MGFADEFDGCGVSHEGKLKVALRFLVWTIQRMGLPFWRRKQMWKEEIWREESKSDFGYDNFNVPIKYPGGTIKQLFGYTSQEIYGEVELDI